jgi:hypothetical protein
LRSRLKSEIDNYYQMITTVREDTPVRRYNYDIGIF